MLESILHISEKPAKLETRYAFLTEILSKNYISIAQLDLNTGYVMILKSHGKPKLEGNVVVWDKLLHCYAEDKVYAEDKEGIHMLTYDYLAKVFAQDQREVSLEVRSLSKEQTYNWVEIAISVISPNEKMLLVTTRNINEDRMLKSIVDLFVFQSFDYFILLDAKNNSYTMFSGKKDGTPIPPSEGSDYTKQVLIYNKRYVSPEDFKRVTANMQIPHIIKMLEKDSKYSFTSGSITDQGNYRRTIVQFQYYDKLAGLILLTRSDITQIFMEEQAKNERLTVALRDAKQDALTGIYNQKATAELVTDLLESQYRYLAAFLFIDVDNFKMINDTLGHQKGDELLHFMAISIQNIAGRAGIAGRIGGDEFLLFLPSVSSIKEIERCAVKVCRLFDSMEDETIKKLPISCSVGISTYPKDGTEYETLVRKADQALYTSKRYGKNQFYFYSQELCT